MVGIVEGVRRFFYFYTPWELALDNTDIEPKFLTEASPFFFGFIVVEWAIGLLGKIREKQDSKAVSLHRWDDVIAGSISGTLQQMFYLFLQVAFTISEVSVYSYSRRNFAPFDVDIKVWPITSFVCLLLFKDLSYYWLHRILHEFHGLWSAHAVHHSGEDYNLSTALRQGVLQAVFSMLFAIPLGLLGFPDEAFSAHSQLNTLYQFWIHTDLVGRLPLGLEYILNSPMAHRMHHRPPGNCNYAGVLIIWDRLFGTYVEEKIRQDYYGLARQPWTFDPFALNVHHFETMRNIQKGWFGRLTTRRVPWKWVCDPRLLTKSISPDYVDERHKGPKRKKWHGCDQSLSGITLAGLFIICATALGMCVVFLVLGAFLPWPDTLFGIILSMLLTSCIGRLLDRHPDEMEKFLLYTTSLMMGIFFVLTFSPVSTTLTTLGFSISTSKQT
eukprot:m.141768 g.141768  ORF g.141768 m.141768 type:complete len:442 (+) comp14862_c0_seq1:167-1492(+)